MVDLAEEYKDIPMLARTHGQFASPTCLKKIEVFVNRLEEQKIHLLQVPHAAKFGGATVIQCPSRIFSRSRLENFGQVFIEDQLGLHYSFQPLKSNITIPLPHCPMQCAVLI